MIQRKQSLFLFLAVIACVVCLFLPIAHIEAEGMGLPQSLFNLGLTEGEGGLSFEITCLPLFLLLSLTAALSLITIFLYKNRSLQLKLCVCMLLFNCLWLVDYILILFGIIPLEIQGCLKIDFAACLPLISIILIVMARKGVSDDEKLVRAADRIR